MKSNIQFRKRILLTLLAASLLFTLCIEFRSGIEPHLFGACKVVIFALASVILSCVFYFINIFWRNINNRQRFFLIGIILILASSLYNSKLITINDKDGQNNFYPMLADAFAHGQLHLIPLPSTELLSLPDPYAPVPGIDKLWDASLYDGKYYLYFGPVPAVILMIVNQFFHIAAGNAFIINFFLILCSIMEFFIIDHIWHQYYPQKSWKLPALCLVSFTFSFPVMWLVGRPSVYEAAISGGQAFLLIGLYLILLSKKKAENRNKLLVGAGIALGLSVGSRWNLAVAVILVSIVELVLLLKTENNSKKVWKPVFSYFIPLILLAATYGFYNYARFGSPFELGQQYQLQGWQNSRNFQLLSINNVKNSLLLYGIIPPKKLSYQYPFITFAGLKENVALVYSSFGITPHPQIGYDNFEKFAALGWVAPITLFSLYAFVLFIKSCLQNRKKRNNKPSPLHWLKQKQNQDTAIILTAAFGGIFPLLFSAGTTMRYHMDYFPCVALLAGIGLFELFSKENPVFPRSFLKIIICSLAFYTVISGLVASITGDYNYFAVAAPDFVKNLNEFLRLLFTGFATAK